MQSKNKIEQLAKLSLEYESESEKETESEKLEECLIDEAIYVISENLDGWVIEWDNYLSNVDMFIETIKVIETEYQKVNAELKRVTENQKFKDIVDVYLDLDLKPLEPKDLVNLLLE